MRLLFTRLILAFSLTFFINPTILKAATFNSNVVAGNWNVAANWSLISGFDADGIPDSDDDVFILNGHSIRVNITSACQNMTLNNGSSLSFNTNAVTLTVGGNLNTIGNGTLTTGGAASRVLNINGNFNINAGSSTSIIPITLNVSGQTNINGSLTVSGTTGAKTFTGSVNFNTGSSLHFVSSETLDMNNVIFNGNVTIGGTTTGIINATSFTCSNGSTVNFGSTSLTVSGTTNINGQLIYTDNLGTKTFTGLINISATGNWNCSGVDETFTINGGITNSGIFQASLTNGAGSSYSFASSGNVTGNFTIPNVNLTGGTTNITNNGTVTITNTFSGGGTWIQANGSVLNIECASITAGLDPSANSNLVNYRLAGAQNILSSISYYNLTISNSGIKSLTNNITILNNLSIENTASLDCGTNRTITINGNWNVTSTNVDPFVENQGRVIFNGTALQTITTVLVGGETFYNLTLDNSFAATPSVTINRNLNVIGNYTQTNGNLDLVGNDLLLTGGSVNLTHNLTSGKIVSSIAGGDFIVTDALSNVRLNLYGTSIGDAIIGIPTTVTARDIYFTNTIVYGTAYFLKTGTGGNDTDGGNIFYGPVTFETQAGADRWRMANVNPDIYYNGTFIHNGNNNYIVSRQTLNNEYFGTTTFTSSTSGGMYISRGNTSSSASSIFHGAVIFNVTLNGNITIAEGGGQNNTATFENTITLNSSATSTGDINFGAGNNNNSILLNSSGAFNGGALSGQTNVRLYNVTQTGNINQVINTVGSTGLLYVGGTTNTTSNYPSFFQGNCTFSSDTAGYISSANFTRNLTFTVNNGNGYLQTCSVNGNLSMTAKTPRVRSNTIQGTSSISQTGSTLSGTNGGNTFNGNTTISNSGTGAFRMASSGADDYNANATFIQTGSGALIPVYSNPVTFAGNISTLGSTSVITFGASTVNTAITDGTGTQTIDGPAAFIPVFAFLQTSHTGMVQLNKSITVSGTLNMVQGNINLNSNTLTLGTGSTGGTVGTLTYASGFMYGGTFTRWQITGNYALTNARGHFPMGTSVGDYRPLWLAYSSNLTSGGTVSVRHNPIYVATYIPASHFDASWGNTVQGVSNSDWTISSANGFAFNGATGQVRYGGTGFGTNVLTDLDASLLSSVVATFSAATNVNTVLEVNRTAISTANLSNIWRIGTRNVTQSPLPIELISFIAKQKDELVELTWETVSEINNELFIIERTVNGNDITEVGSVEGAGNSNSHLYYQLEDIHPLLGESYYRLKQIDFNGEFSYSNWIKVNIINNFDLLIYPNPSNQNEVNINLPITTDDILVDMIDMNGKKIFSQRITKDERTNLNYHFSYGDIPAGVYFINLSYENQSSSAKLIVN